MGSIDGLNIALILPIDGNRNDVTQMISQAISEKDWNCVNKILLSAEPSAKVLESSYTAIWEHIGRIGNVDALATILDKYMTLLHKNITLCKNLGTAILRGASLSGQLNIIVYVFDQIYMDVDDVRSCDNCMIRYAARNGHIDILKFLFHRFPLTIDDVRSQYNQMIRLAAKAGYVDILKLLFDRFPLSMEDVCTWRNYAIIMAARNGHMDVLEFFVWRFPSILNGVTFHNSLIRDLINVGHTRILNLISRYHPHIYTRVIACGRFYK